MYVSMYECMMTHTMGFLKEYLDKTGLRIYIGL